MDKVSETAQRQARDGEDFSSLTRAWVYLEDGQTSVQVPLAVLNDDMPELEERFRLRLDSVQVDEQKTDTTGLEAPRLGEVTEAVVVIAVNDNAFGVFSIIKASGAGAGSSSDRVLEVLESDRLAVDFIVERQGGALGEVTVEWSISTVDRTAAYGQDFIADGATLVFATGQTRRVITLTVLDDRIPENNEGLTVALSSPTGGATLSSESFIRLVILANDFVAGMLSFEKTSALVNEGDEIKAVILRSSPGEGTVTANWVIKGKNGIQGETGFMNVTGSLIFAPGELRKEILLNVLSDDRPEVNEEYVMSLEDIKTTGVVPSGKAQLNPQRGSFLITIAASDEPHGIFQLGLTSSKITVEEDVGTASIRVDRKFGAIGTVRVSYTVTEGSLEPYGTQRSPASAGQDFSAVDSGFIDIRDGETSGLITITIVDDAIPEIDEVFVLRLTSVGLIDSTDNSQPPKLDNNALETEIIINANDGAKGIIEFAQDSQSVQVTEQGQKISLTVVRGGGTFGRVTVFFYSQPLTESTVTGQDYVMTDEELVFEEGESRKSIVITIVNDDDPEPAETFNVILANPSNGAALGDKARASITVLANDNAGGVITFDSADLIQLREATDEDVSGSKAEILIRRGPGAFGTLSVPFTITTPLGQFTGDVKPETGTIDFADRQTSAVLVLESVNDNTPEVEEKFTLLLKEPTEPEAILGNIKSRTVVVSASDAPYGLMEIFTANSRLSSYSVEEAVNTLEFDVVRSQGTLGRVSVDVMTVPGTATAVTDMKRVVLAPITSAPGRAVVDWHHITEEGQKRDASDASSFLVMLTSLPSNTPLESLLPSTNGLGTGQSMLFKWQGQLTPLKTFATDGATAATSFISNGNTYLVVTNSGREGARQVSSFLYRVSNDGDLEVIQGIPTSGASDVTTFTHGDRRFLFVTNSLDDNSRSDIASHLYSWDSSRGQFGSAPSQLVKTLYAKGVDSFTVDGKTFVAVANYFDRSSGSYQISSVIYRMESDFTLVQHQQLTTQGAVSLVYTQAGNMHLLCIANNRQDAVSSPQDSAVYRWDLSAQAFVLHQTLKTNRAMKVTAHTTSAGSGLLIFANSVGNSEIFIWDVESSRYVSGWTGGPYQALRPVVFHQPNGDLDAIGAAYLNTGTAPEILQIAHLASGSDFVPRRVTLSFEPGQASLRTSVVTLTDDKPEDKESFSVSLVSPTGGAELGPSVSVTVDILSNDDAHGIIEFNEDSLEITVEEAVDKDTTVQINVVRRLGYFGRVTVAWQATGDHNGVGDVTPLSGQVEFPNGQSVATITLTVRDDKEPEFAEVTYVRLTEIVDAGTNVNSKGAKLGSNTVAMITVLANDSPYGVVSWERSDITVVEPEGSDKAVEIAITRRQGLERAIRVNYVTSIAASLAENSQATPGEDFVSTQGNVVMAEGMSKVNVVIFIKQDSFPEADETFLVNLTSVSFQTADVDSGAAPSIALNGGVIQITITENDNARGFVEFDVKTNIEGRIDVYETFGKDTPLQLSIVRRVGLFGSIIVTWQADPVEADILDFSPASGTVELADQQETANIVINILDDDVPENMETFDVKLISVTGDAGLGETTTVRIAILKNDSPTGLFQFATAEMETQESKTTTDPAGQVTLLVKRVKGTQGLVNVRWRLNAEAEDDFMPPLEDTVQFIQGEVEKAIVLQTRPDTILEGREEFTISLVSADNNADISNTNGNSKIIILPNAGASGTISILPEFRSVVVGEQGESAPGYRGEVEVKLTRGLGIFGEVVVTWSLTPRDLSAFLQVEGSLKFLDLQQTASIVLQTRDDSVPELRQIFTLQLNSASGGAVLSPLAAASTATVTYAASDHPHGLVQFLLPAMTVVSEDQETVVITVSRGRGLNGELQVAYSTEAVEATPNKDFLPSAGILTFPAGVDKQTITITILADDISEGPEDFLVKLNSVKLSGDTNDYVEVNGLTRDMAPALGPLPTKTIRIDKNDNAEGVMQFSQDTYFVKEESGTAILPVVRLLGSYGQVSVSFVTEMLTAREGDDYVKTEGELVLDDGIFEAGINVTIIDDFEMEQAETLKVVISDVKGGALLGMPATATVTILKSDFPNGRFAFQGPSLVSLPNPDKPQRQAFLIERTAGVLGRQEAFWRIMGPNNPNIPLADTADVSHLSEQGSEVTAGSFTWADGESGTRQLVIDVKAYTSWEVEKTFVLELYRVVGTPPGVGAGEVAEEGGNVALKIERFGDPNGVVELTGEAATARQILEPDGVSPAMLVFPITRRTGTGVLGTIQVYWEVRPSDIESPDVQPAEGSIIMSEGQRDAQIILQILPDNIPELTEDFSLVLVRVDGGATLGLGLSQSNFSIRYNDQPYGELGLVAEDQAVEVNAADMSRHVKIAVARMKGTFGAVLATYTISYDESGTGIALEPSTGTVTFEPGQNETVTLVSIKGNAFLKVESTFTVRLTEVRLLGKAVGDPPTIVASMAKVQIAVPALAANTELSFSSDEALVNEDDQTMTITLKRAGTFGSLTADWISGYTAANKPEGVENGLITPSLGSVNMVHGQEEASFVVQLAAEVNRTEAFVLRLPRSPQTTAMGGARLATTNLVIQADPAGVVRFSDDSLEMQASELEGKLTLSIWRLYGYESRLAVYYKTIPDTAEQALDFEHFASGVLTFEPMQTVAQIELQIFQDNLPEQSERFYVKLTSVERLPTPIEPTVSPRLSEDKSMSVVTIQESNDAYGILSLSPVQVEVEEGFTLVSLTVARKAGDFGAVSVTVRTVGGGEGWSSQVVPDSSATGPTDTIAQALGRRTSQETAMGGIDYEILDTVVELQAREKEKQIQVRILEDNTPEPEETVLVYLTRPLGGARIATGTPDGGKKGFAMISISASDLSNGIIGFALGSRSVTVEEDVWPPRAALQLIRLNTFIGDVLVKWEAKKSLTSNAQQDAVLETQLNATAGTATCPAEQSRCDLHVYLLDDNVPEESFSFVVLLTSTDPDAQLNEDSKHATVTIGPSDDVQGLFQFAPDSRTVIVGETELSTRLTVKRERGQGYDVGVAYETQQMSDSVQVSGSTVYPALDNQDFRGQTGTLAFESGVQEAEYITVSLTPVLASDNPLPKQFYVSLHTPTNGARVDPLAGVATIRIVNDADVAIWRVVSQSDGNAFSDDTVIIDVVNRLDTMAEGELTDGRLDLIENTLQKINTEGDIRRLPTSVVTSVRNLYCKLLDGSLNDARKGRHSLAATLESFSYTLVTGSPCTDRGPASQTIKSTECSAVRIASGRWTPDILAGASFTLQLQNKIEAPSTLPDMRADIDGINDGCVDFSLLEYRSQTWFDGGSSENRLLNDRIVGFALKGRPSGSIRHPVTFTIHTPDRRIAAKGAECKYFDEGSERWVSPDGVCRVVSGSGGEDTVTCECLHMTHYGVTARTEDDDVVGYEVWFYVVCFLCMTSIVLAVLVHHLFFTNATFTASLHMHFLMAVFFAHMCFVIDAFLSEDELLAPNGSDSNSKCIAMSLFLHYFFLTQFMWMAAQAVNIWKIFIMNDEHTDRHYFVFFLMGWGVPVVLVAIFYAVTYNIYRYHTDLNVKYIYGDVNNNQEICFITNEFAALAGILAPVLVCLLVLGIVCMKAYQVASQWHMYDDVYRGRSNERELPWVLLLYGVLVMVCLWLALHMIYGYLWLMVLFCVFDVILAILILVLYAVIRNPLFACAFGPAKASYSVSTEVSTYPDHQLNYYSSTPSVKGSHANLLNDTWESGTDGGRSRMTVRRALPSQTYIDPPIAVINPAGTISSDSPDFDDLIFALKMGSPGMRSLTPSDLASGGGSGSGTLSFRDDDISQLSVVLDHYETKRIDIADTHL